MDPELPDRIGLGVVSSARMRGGAVRPSSALMVRNGARTGKRPKPTEQAEVGRQAQMNECR